MKIHNIIIILALFCLPSVSKIDLDATSQLGEIEANSLVVDALLPQNSSTLLVSKHGQVSESLLYQIDWVNDLLSLKARQTFTGFAPIFLENRDGIFAFKFLAARAQEKAKLYKLDEQDSFQPFFTFQQNMHNIATTLASNFFATVDYTPAVPEKIPLSLARLKLFITAPNAQNEQGLIEKTNVKITNQKQVITGRDAENQVTFKDIIGQITSLAMSPLKRIKVPNQPDISANRMVAIAHSLDDVHRLHVWYFPDLTNDFTKSKGHFPMTLNSPIDTIVFSPNTFGLMLLTNKQQGKIWVVKVEFPGKTVTFQELDLEKALIPNATHIQALFGPHDEILAGINQSLYLFTKNNDGTYAQADTQPVKDFAAQEPFSKIVNQGSSFLAIGMKGHVQFGRIDLERR